MKRVALTLALAALALLWTLARGQVQPPDPAPRLDLWTTNWLAQAVAAQAPATLALSQAPVLVPKLRGLTNSPTLLFRLPPHRSPSGPIRPGLYQSAPYTCLVLVPGPCADDKSVFGTQSVDPRMPKVEPDVRLIPGNRSADFQSAVWQNCIPSG